MEYGWLAFSESIGLKLGLVESYPTTRGSIVLDLNIRSDSVKCVVA